MNFYDLKAKKPNGTEVAMSDFKGKVVLVVNTATKCGLTPQFEGLEKLHQVYKDQGLVVLGFPCNQFGSQEPLSNEEMEATCEINHGVTFQLMQKVDVNGKDAAPLFKFLKKKLPTLLGKSIKWNFAKFLIDANGKPFRRYSPTTKPHRLDRDIKKLLARQKQVVAV